MMVVKAVCISKEKGTVKNEVELIECKCNHGIIGDAHAGNWHRQISLLANESVDRMREKYPKIAIGAFGENILTEGIVLSSLPIGSKLRIGKVLLQVTQIGKECHKGCAIRNQVGDCVMPREGIFTIVLEEGIIKAGDQITIIQDEII